MIGEGRVLLLAGSEADLAAMPTGCWIGGTVGHFVTPQGSVEAQKTIFYTDFTSITNGADWRSFGVANIHELAQHYPANGFALIILPGFSRLLSAVAGRIMEFDGLYNVPLMGWVSAVGLDEPLESLPEETPKVFAGGPQPHAERAAVLYVSLPAQYFAQLHIANLFTPGHGPDIRFFRSGQYHSYECMIGGASGNLARYMEEHGIDKRLPLVADQDGALINAAILVHDASEGAVTFLTPVSASLTYRFAEEIPDYSAEFARIAADMELPHAAHACICVLHHYFASQSGPAFSPAPRITGPVTFGQIAYTILNQTLICLTIGRSEDLFEDLPADG